MATRLKKISRLYLVRHGQSVYNLENKFTGWKDVDLTDKGINEAKDAGNILKDVKFTFAYTSVLKRAINTLDFIQPIEQLVQIYLLIVVILFFHGILLLFFHKYTLKDTLEISTE